MPVSPPIVSLKNDNGSSSSDFLTNIGVLSLSGVQPNAIVEYSIDSGATWTNRFSAVAGSNVVQVRQTVAGEVSDSSAPLAFTLDTTAPTLPGFTRNGPAATAGSTVSYTVTFSEAVTGVDASAFAIDASSTDAAASITGVIGSGSTYVVTIDTGGVGHDGTIALRLNGQNVSDLAGNGFGGGVFTPTQSIVRNMVSSVSSIATADFNGDGKTDIVGNAVGPFVPVLLATDDSSFANYFYLVDDLDLRFGSVPTILTTDVNNDGNADIIAPSAEHIAIFLGNGNGTFQQPRDFSVTAFQLLVTDFNGDGFSDFIAADWKIPHLSVLVAFGDGDGNFTTQAVFAETGVTRLAVGDFNGDG